MSNIINYAMVAKTKISKLIHFSFCAWFEIDKPDLQAQITAVSLKLIKIYIVI